MILLAVLFSLLSGVPAAGAPGEEEKQDDLVYLINGDRISGEIRKLDDGVLYIRTSLAGDVEIKWEHVRSLEGRTTLAVTLADETQRQGTLNKAEGEGKILVDAEDGGSIEVEPDFLQLAETLDKPPVDRFKGSVNFGLTLLKAKETRQFNLGLKGSYSADAYYAEASYDTFYTTDNSSGQNYRDYLNTLYQRNLPRDWFFTGMFNTARNDALELDLRYNLNAALGKDIIHTNTATLQALAGAGFVSETYESGEDHSDLETVLGLKLKALEIASPKMSMTAEVMFYPRPADFDRYRIETRTGLNLMLVRNIFWGFSFFDSYNSKPPSPGAVKNDYGLVSSIGVNW